jgi:DNA polymerase III delta prime subunit
MKNYTFETLSSLEFEHLSRDLLQAELDLLLESFPAGRDQGIDARWVGTGSHGDENIIVQCKHYAKSGFNKLLGVLKDEKKKIEKLKPTRYILTTSVGLTPNNKNIITENLKPYCLRPSDIFAVDDLNNLLGKHEQVERRHYKLWLTSTAVLAKLFTASTFLDSEAAVMHIRERLKRYVQNDSFPRALELLERSRFCLIVGNPGIGKTTLAEALLVHHVDLDYQALRITNRLSELKGIIDPEKKQVFYYDDFLGKTGLDKTEHKEDQQLVEFLELVADNPHWRFILTTRNYILNAALIKSEALAQFPFDVATCVVQQEDYTRPIKARILYNHLYFSSLPAETKLALIGDNEYKQIVEHPNYNPRIIEHMTDLKRLKNVNAENYLEEFISALDNPLRVWAHAFRQHLSQSARHVLLALFTLPDSAQLEELSRVFWILHNRRREEHNIATLPSDFETALKELDGNFVSTDRSPYGLVAKFQNPSVRDFLEEHLAEVSSDARDLFRIADQTVQFRTLWSGRRGEPFQGVLAHVEEFIEIFAKTVAQEFERDRVRRDIPHPVYKWEMPWLRLSLALDIYERMPSSFASVLVNKILADFTEAVDAGDVLPNEVEEALRAVNKGRFPHDAPRREFIQSAKRYFLRNIDELDDLEYVGTFVRQFPWSITQEELESIRNKFIDMAEAQARSSSWMDYPGTLRDVADKLETLAVTFGVDVSNDIDEIRHQANKNEDEDDDTSQASASRLVEPEGEQPEDEARQYIQIDSDFASYRNELSQDKDL